MEHFAVINVDKFYVISVCSNPIRYQSRWKLFKQFESHITKLGAKLLVVEQAFGNREYQLTEKHNPMHVQVRTKSELWHKENMINIAIQYLTQLDPDWEYVAWIDGDVHFQRDDIITETAHQLQHYDIVQMFSHAIDLGPEMQPLSTFCSFMYMYHQNDFYPPKGIGQGGYYTTENKFWHPGYAWAATREALNKVQLFDKAILGAGDHHMALGLIGEAKRSVPGHISNSYKKAVLDWETNAVHSLQKNVGYVPGSLTHYWHGAKNNRKYVERWKIITDHGFDPVSDLSRESSGLYRLNMCYGDRSIRLRDHIRKYFRQRNEDCIYNVDQCH
jgi:hypothetical protein